MTSACMATPQSPNQTTQANQTVAYQRWHRQATTDPRVSSAPSSLMPGGEEHKERCEHTRTHSILSFPVILLFTCELHFP